MKEENTKNLLFGALAYIAGALLIGTQNFWFGLGAVLLTLGMNSINVWYFRYAVDDLAARLDPRDVIKFYHTELLRVIQGRDLEQALEALPADKVAEINAKIQERWNQEGGIES